MCNINSRESLGLEYPSTLKSLNDLARSVAGQDKYKEAEEIDRRVLSIREKVLRVEHPCTLSSLSNLSCDLGHQAKYTEAEEIGRRVFSYSQRVLGLEHPETIRIINNLACFLRNLREYGKAEPLFQRAIQAREKVLGLEHPETLQSIWDLGVLCKVQGRYLEALELYERACSGYENVLGEYHPDTRRCSKGYLDLLAKIKSKRSLGSLLAETSSLVTLVGTSRKEGKREDATELLGIAVEGCEKVLENDHIVTWECSNEHSDLLAKKESLRRRSRSVSAEVSSLVDVEAPSSTPQPVLSAKPSPAVDPGQISLPILEQPRDKETVESHEKEHGTFDREDHATPKSSKDRPH